MRAARSSALGAALALVLARPASAQVVNPARLDPAPNLVGLAVGLDSGAALEAAYARSLRAGVLPAAFVSGRLLVPSSPDFGDLAFGSTVQAAWIDTSGWGVQPGFGLEARRVEGALVEVTQLAVTPSVVLGHFRPSWMVAAEVTWDRSLLTHVSPTDTYQTRGYASAKGGLFGGGGGTLRSGLRAGVGVTSTTDVTLRGSLVTTDGFVWPAGLPFYALLGVTQRF